MDNFMESKTFCTSASYRPATELLYILVSPHNMTVRASNRKKKTTLNDFFYDK